MDAFDLLAREDLEPFERYYLAACRLAARAGIHKSKVPTFRPEQFQGYWLQEAGSELELWHIDMGRGGVRVGAWAPDEMLFQVMHALTWAKADEYEMLHHRAGQDRRRVFFTKHIELMHELSPAWGARVEADYGEVLQAHPFSDGAPPPGGRDLRAWGHPERTREE